MYVVLPMTSSGYCVGKKDFSNHIQMSMIQSTGHTKMQKCKLTQKFHRKSHFSTHLLFLETNLAIMTLEVFCQKTFPTKIKPSTTPLRSVMSSMSNTLHKASVVKSRVQWSFQKLGQSFFLARWWPEFVVTSPKQFFTRISRGWTRLQIIFLISR